MRRVDIFRRPASLGPITQPETAQCVAAWTCYVQSVIPSNAARIAKGLEAEGDLVRLFTTSRSLGRLVYETSHA